jgi:hypothetical protein
MEADIANERIALKTTAPNLKGEDAYQIAADNVTQRAIEYDRLIQQIERNPAVEYQQGREVMKEFLDQQLGTSHASNSLEVLELRRSFVQRQALEASQSLADDKFQSGMRKGIMEWSHEHNHELKQQIERIQPSVQVEQEVAALRVSPDARIAAYQASVGATAEERVQSYLRTPEETQLFEQGRHLISRDLNEGLTLQQVRHEHDVIRSQGEEPRWSPQDVSRQAGYLADEMRTRIIDHPPTVEIHAGTYRWDQEAFRQGAQQGVSDFSLQHNISQGREQSVPEISYSPQYYANTLSSYQDSIRTQWAESLALATDTPERLAGHFRDEIAGLNQQRQELIQQNPQLEKTLPPAMDYRQELVHALDAGWQKQAQQEQTVQVGYGF